jgi:hypothetical protein
VSKVYSSAELVEELQVLSKLFAFPQRVYVLLKNENLYHGGFCKISDGVYNEFGTYPQRFEWQKMMKTVRAQSLPLVCNASLAELIIPKVKIDEGIYFYHEGIMDFNGLEMYVLDYLPKPPLYDM